MSYWTKHKEKLNHSPLSRKDVSGGWSLMTSSDITHIKPLNIFPQTLDGRNKFDFTCIVHICCDRLKVNISWGDCSSRNFFLSHLGDYCATLICYIWKVWKCMWDRSFSLFSEKKKILFKGKLQAIFFKITEKGDFLSLIMHIVSLSIFPNVVRD